MSLFFCLWHDMLTEYVNKCDSFLVRNYESGLNGNTNDNRRGAKVEFEDGFSIIYASNYDAQEIFNMAVKGIKPDLTEFSQLIKNGDYRIHYSSRSKCTESKISFCKFYNNGEKMLGGVLTNADWYLAHIRGVKDLEYQVNGRPYFINRKKMLVYVIGYSLMAL